MSDSQQLSSQSAVRCQQCGAPVSLDRPPGRELEVQTCAYCATVLLVTDDDLRVAGRDLGGALAAGAWDPAVALCCLVCGGPLPATIAAAPEATRCDFCGSLARLKPGVATLLRLAVTRPRLLPPAARRALVFWGVGLV